jgi:UDP-N-acetylglucosamine/UDP-N-acetylgalactosamine 4-epimerase
MSEAKYHEGSLEQMSFLVTGGAGFIGSNIVEYLLSYGAGKVRVLDNLSTGNLGNIRDFMDNPAFDFVEGDIRDISICRKAVEGIDYVSHQAALGSVPRSINDPLTTNEVNINGHLNMLVASRDEGVKRMVYAASSSTYGDSVELPKEEDRIGKPLSPYAITKYVNELYSHIFSTRYGFHTIGLRYFNVFGPRQDPSGAYAAVIPLFFRAAIERVSPTIHGDGEQTRDFTYVQNAVQANMKAMFIMELEEHCVFNIAVGNRISLNMLWEKITELVGCIDLHPMYGASRDGDVRHSLADISRAKKILNYDPLVSVEEGLSLLHCSLEARYH